MVRGAASLELERDDHPRSFCVRLAAYGGAARDEGKYPSDVILEVPPVVRQVWIPPSCIGRKENLHAPTERHTLHPRPDRPVFDGRPDEWLLEFTYERGCKPPHLCQGRYPGIAITLQVEACEKPRRNEHGK